MNCMLYTDGGSRGNPGPAAIGGVLMDAQGFLLAEFSQTIGSTTNNQAEYRSLIHGIELALKQRVRRLNCFLDSELIVKQLNGQYRIKDPDLSIQASVIQKLRTRFAAISFTHIPREQNQRADALVNAALDSET